MINECASKCTQSECIINPNNKVKLTAERQPIDKLYCKAELPCCVKKEYVEPETNFKIPQPLCCVLQEGYVNALFFSDFTECQDAKKNPSNKVYECIDGNCPPECYAKKPDSTTTESTELPVPKEQPKQPNSQPRKEQVHCCYLSGFFFPKPKCINLNKKDCVPIRYKYSKIVSSCDKCTLELLERK